MEIPDQLSDFDDAICRNALDSATVTNDGRIAFRFQDGTITKLKVDSL